jgi:thiamine-phosphate pyrophosphorylase
MHKNFLKTFIFLDKYDSQIFKNNNTNIGIIYRNYSASKREKELIKIVKACKKNRNQLFVSNDFKLAIKVKAEGIYIPSFSKTKGFFNLEKKNIKIIGSAHNQGEIQKKRYQNCSAIFLSPIFYIEKSKKFLDIHKFNYISYRNKTNILALGGISNNNLHKLKLLNIKGFGGIRMFKKKPAYKRPVFIKNNFF